MNNPSDFGKNYSSLPLDAGAASRHSFKTIKMKRLLSIVLCIILIGLDCYALYAGLFLYVFNCWTLTDGESADWSLIIFFGVVFVNLLMVIIFLLKKIVIILSSFWIHDDTDGA